MLKLKFLLITLLFFVMSIASSPQIKTNQLRNTTNKNLSQDSSEIKDQNKNRLTHSLSMPSWRSLSPGTQMSLGKLSPESLMLNNDLQVWSNDFSGQFSKNTIDFAALDLQKNDLFLALRETQKKESPELQFIRRYLGLSRDMAAFILLLMHLIKYK